MNSSRRISILYIITQSEFGGAQKYVYYLANGLTKEKYEVTVACGIGGLLINRLKESNVEVVPIPELVREISPLKDCLAFIRLIRVIRKGKFHIVHTNSTKAGILGRLAAKLAGVPIVLFTTHGFVLNEPMGWLRKLVFSIAERIAGYFTDIIIAVTEADRQTVIKYNIVQPHRIITIHNGLDTDAFKNSIMYKLGQKREELGLPSDRKIIVGIVANFYPTKGLQYFIKAAKLVKKAFPETLFVIIGDGQQREELKELVDKLGLTASILFKGQRDDVAEILPLFDVFVLSSVKEGLPFALLESMAAARPIVATKVGGIPEVIRDGETGYLVPPCDPESLAKAICSLLADKEKAREIGLSAKKRVVSSFSLKKMVEKTEKVYETLLKSKGLL